MQKQGEEKTKETIEEVFRSWHRENESEVRRHLEYELEHGRSGKTDANDAAQGMKRLRSKKPDMGHPKEMTVSSGANEETR